MYLQTINKVCTARPGATSVGCGRNPRAAYRIVRVMVGSNGCALTEILSDSMPTLLLAWINAAEKLERTYPVVLD